MLLVWVLVNFVELSVVLDTVMVGVDCVELTFVPVLFVVVLLSVVPVTLLVCVVLLVGVVLLAVEVHVILLVSVNVETLVSVSVELTVVVAFVVVIVVRVLTVVLVVLVLVVVVRVVVVSGHTPGEFCIAKVSRAEGHVPSNGMPLSAGSGSMMPIGISTPSVSTGTTMIDEASEGTMTLNKSTE
jgi:hypothetical protein